MGQQVIWCSHENLLKFHCGRIQGRSVSTERRISAGDRQLI